MPEAPQRPSLSGGRMNGSVHARDRRRYRHRVVAPAPRFRLRLGLTVIPLIAVLFAGVVWLNAAKLAILREALPAVRVVVILNLPSAIGNFQSRFAYARFLLFIFYLYFFLLRS